jgi:hypothetical protein
MPPFMMGYHGPKPGTIWYTVQAIFMSSLFGAGAVVISYMAIVNGDPICFTGAVFCAIFCILFIIGYFVDTKGLDRKVTDDAKDDYKWMDAKPPSNKTVVTAPEKVQPQEEPRPLGSDKEELIR